MSLNQVCVTCIKNMDNLAADVTTGSGRPRNLLMLWAIMLTIFAGSMAVYVYYVCFLPDSIGVTYYHGRLGSAFLSGHTYLEEMPNPGLKELDDPYEPNQNASFRLHDASYYNDKYYLYFGPVPALVLWIPVKVLTGVALSDEQMALILGSTGTLCLFWLVYAVAMRMLAATPQALNPVYIGGLALVWLSLGLGTWLPFILRRAHFYEVSITGAYCFTAMGLVCLWYFLHDIRRFRWLFLASLCFALSVGCRMIHIFSGIFLLLTLIYMLRLSVNFRALIRGFVVMSVPMLTGLVALATYNYVRFDTPFETGLHYQLGMYNANSPEFSFYRPEAAPFYTYRFLLYPLTWRHSSVLPAVAKDWGGYPSPITEPVYGMWANMPFSVLFLLFLADRRTRKTLMPATRLMAGGLVFYTVALFASLATFFFNTQRYILDFSPWMMLVACIYYLYLLRRFEQARLHDVLLLLGGALVVYGTVAGVLAGYCGHARLC